MSGTSLDGVDGVAIDFSTQPPRVLADTYIGFDQALRGALFALQLPGYEEIDREARAANALVGYYGRAVAALRKSAKLDASQIIAIGVHGQTIRHYPERGYTRQINNPALLAELAGIDVIADFRSRDIAAGGQGAPLAPAFHAAMFGVPDQTRVICNLGGISNITILAPGRAPRGFDCGPANALLDLWSERHTGARYDEDGRFAARGKVDHALLAMLRDEKYFSLPPPKSTGRDLFNAHWLDVRLAEHAALPPEDVQATLTALSAVCVARDVARYAKGCADVYVCGGGARNPVLMRAMAEALAGAGMADTRVNTTAALGIPPDQVEACAFAWLAMRCATRQPCDLHAITGGKGPRVLGAIYPR